MVKIGSVTSEILLIWKNVARTNVVWTNVIMTLDPVIDVPRNLPLKFDLNWASNSSMAYMVVVETHFSVQLKPKPS